MPKFDFILSLAGPCHGLSIVPTSGPETDFHMRSMDEIHTIAILREIMKNWKIHGINPKYDLI